MTQKMITNKSDTDKNNERHLYGNEVAASAQNNEIHLTVEIVFAKPERQKVVNLCVAQDTTVEQVLTMYESMYPEECPVNWRTLPIGNFGCVIQLNKRVEANMRLEIYRPLVISPKEARQRRALLKQKKQAADVN